MRLASGPIYSGVEQSLAMEVFEDKNRPDTGLVICETPANPTPELLAISDVVAQAGEVPVLVDSTFATPVLQQPAQHGAALVMHSATKFLGDHGDVIGGVVA